MHPNVCYIVNLTLGGLYMFTDYVSCSMIYVAQGEEAALISSYSLGGLC